MACLVVTLGASLFYVRLRFLFIEMNYEVAQKQSLRTQLEKDNRGLTIELATLSSPARIERFARTRLGLRKSDSAVPSVVLRRVPTE